MKKSSLKIPILLILVLSSIYFGVVFRGDRGDLNNPDLIRMVYRPLVSLSGWFTDRKLQVRGDRTIRNKIVIVAMDIDSVARFGRWPWHRDFFAQIFEAIDQQHPKVIGSDLLMAEKEVSVPEGLRQALIAQNLKALANQYETDPVLTATLKKLAPRIVVGIGNQSLCQPSQSADSRGGLCPSFDEKYEKAFREGFDRFSIRNFFKPKTFDFSSSPVFISQSPVLNQKNFQDVIEHLGYFAIDPDPDGVNRQTLLVSFANEFPIPSFALKVAAVAANDELAVELGDSNKIKRLYFANSKRNIAISPVGRMEVNYRGSPNGIPHLSVVDLMSSEKFVPVKGPRPLNCVSCKSAGRVRGKSNFSYLIDREELLKDSIVMVGTTDLSIDIRPIPNFSTAAGVEGHAMVVDNLLSGDWYRPRSDSGSGIAVLLLLTVGALCFSWAVGTLSSVPAVLVFVVTLLVLAWIDVGVLLERGINLNSGFVYIEYFSIGFLLLINKYVFEEEQRKFIKHAFSRFVSPQVVQTILEDHNQLALSGARRELTVMFSDIREFMPFSARLAPQQLHMFLNEYHDAMTGIVIEKGTLDKYIGDAIMAFWGAPLEQPAHAANACRAALGMVAELKRLNQHFKESYGHEISIGIGLNTGQVIVGNMGSKEVFSYTIIGDDVNLASRVERLTRVYGVTIVATRATLDSILNAGEPLPAHRVLDKVQVMGAAHAIEAVQILDYEYPSDALEAFALGRLDYDACRWDEAIQKFELARVSIQKKLGFVDHPCTLMIERCQNFKIEPPGAPWDGVWHMTKK